MLFISINEKVIHTIHHTEIAVKLSTSLFETNVAYSDPIFATSYNERCFSLMSHGWQALHFA